MSRCTHHWLIEEANGPVSGGVCKRCGARRGFANSEDAIAERVALTRALEQYGLARPRPPKTPPNKGLRRCGLCSGMIDPERPERHRHRPVVTR